MGADAWSLAREAAANAGVRLRPLTSLEDGEAIVRVMIATCGDHQTLPRELLRALAASGNVPYGAYAGEELVGYVLGWAGVDELDGLHVHSHMLAALPQRRHRGIGYALKLAQRAQALDVGIGVARWTFDPLVSRNAYFNLRKLGAVADRFERDYYGPMGDALNRDDRSDRLVVRWDLSREPGPRPLPPGEELTVLEAAGDPRRPRPERVAEPVARAEGSVAIRLPREYAELRSEDPALAARWREAIAEALEACLALGLIAVTFHPGEEGSPASYSLATPAATVERRTG